MELSSVSPPAASPTEGADLCETHVTNVAIHSVTLLICLCGLAGNGAVLRCISLEEFVLFFFGLAVTDFLFLLFALPSALLFLLEDVSCSPVMPLGYVSFIFQLSVASYYWGLFSMTAISIILCESCFLYDHYERLKWMLMFALFWAVFTVITVIPTVTILCPAHEQEHCRVALTSMFIIILILIAVPVVIFITRLYVKATSEFLKETPKRSDIIILLIVLLTLLLSLLNFLQQLGYITMSSQVVFLLTCIHSSIKPFNYFLAGMYKRPCSVRSLRESLQRVFEEPDGNTGAMNSVPMSLLSPSPALLTDPGTMAEAFLESPDQ